MFSPKGQDYGSFGFAFTITRALQAICLICILSMSANFIAEINSVDTAPHQSSLQLSVVIVVVFLLIGYLLYLELQLSFLLATAFDTAALIALIVVSVKVGTPLSYLECPALPNVGVTSAFVESAVGNFSKANYYFWVGASKTACYEMKAIWGLAWHFAYYFSSVALSTCAYGKRTSWLR
ncbi:hypothetical protein H4I95_01617 [Botrytis cinerea]